MDVKISACQFRIQKSPSFDAFQKQVEELINQVPEDSDYVIFPELLTIGLFASFNQTDISSLSKIDKYSGQYKDLFSSISKRRKQIIIAGSHLERRENNYYNISYIFDKDGSYIEHKKTHIFPAEASWQIAEGNDLEVYSIGPVKIGLAICYEAEIPEISRILSVNGADILFCPSFTFTEAGFWRVRHCGHARAIENQVYFVHCPIVGEPGDPLPNGYGSASIISPCDAAWPENGIIIEAEPNKHTVITGTVNIDELYLNRKHGAATTFKDRTRRGDLYRRYEPYNSI
ncbi:nitrilase-related carbon-nitrogen hydrolase [Neobacillus massiliamazoniensis]|uniref:Nitrilase/cyanide hydratase and apolipoprotein n-acyltransferase n=1 Tax=Neobacillus massiliamazoniensis TaxID=1499688 RepID=A0A0U1NVY8_9BACI|nr:nitrilase-related carbon-nitrogen hydrolase [Neobacillus massiliamazoniensis]CRK82191.1 nitrilase/cyanide hydratase and apolipoprotein n-acyltransferase [Neobacillus massiliamazoniensis]